LAQSAVEWIASASIEPEPVQNAATYFATAMPKLAPSA
jgi:hypothetical protein